MSAAKSTSIYNRPIIDDEYCEKLDKGWKCKWCNKQYGQINQTRILIHFSRMAMHGVKGIEFCSGEINQEKLNYYQSKMRQHNSRKEIKKNQARQQDAINEATVTTVATNIHNKKNLNLIIQI